MFGHLLCAFALANVALGGTLFFEPAVKDQNNDNRVDTSSVPKENEISAKGKIVICPDKTSMCPDGTTCCKLESGQYGCCPYEKATCCSDQLHCCPQGKTCDVKGQTCVGGGLTVPWSQKFPAHLPKDNTNPCPDGSSCPTETTCCKMPSGKYGCCPFPKALCCSDNIHCCPDGETCGKDECKSKSGKTSPLKKKFPAFEEHVNNVICPDQTSYCPDGNTCCKQASGQYGCCPFPLATCCSDQTHCCPNGYQCDPTRGDCFKSGPDLLLRMFDVKPRTKGKQVPMQLNIRLKTQVKLKEKHMKDGCDDLEINAGKTTPKIVFLKRKLLQVDEEGVVEKSGGNVLKFDKEIDEEIVTMGRCDSDIHKDEEKNEEKMYTEQGNKEEDNGDEDRNEEMKHKKQHGKKEKNSNGKGKKILGSSEEAAKGELYKEKISKGNDKKTKGLSEEAAKGELYKEKISKGNDKKTKRLSEEAAKGELYKENISKQNDKKTKGLSEEAAKGELYKEKISKQNDKKTKGLSEEAVKGELYKEKISKQNDKKTKGLSEEAVKDELYKNGKDKKTPKMDHRDYAKVEKLLRKIEKKRNKKDLVEENQPLQDFKKSKGNSKEEQNAKNVNEKELLKGNTNKGEIFKENVDDSNKENLKLSKAGAPNVEEQSNKETKDSTAASQSQGIDPKSDVDSIGPLQDHSNNAEIVTEAKKTEESILKGATDDPSHLDGVSGGLPRTEPTGKTSPKKKGAPVDGKEESTIFWAIVKFMKMVDVFLDEELEEALESVQEGWEYIMTYFGVDSAEIPKDRLRSDAVRNFWRKYTKDTLVKSKTEVIGKHSKRPLWKYQKASKLTGNEMALIKANTEEKACPETGSTCPMNTTCCKMQSGHYGCCPIENAICCASLRHCCKQGQTCDNDKLLCMDKDEPEETTPAPSNGVIVCNDHTSTCPDTSTCCIMDSGKYGCCPMKNAVCCSDKVHCCPSGHTCDIAKGLCQRKDSPDTAVPMSLKQPALNEDKVTCKNNITCPDKSTCCPAEGGLYACCPLEGAVCCKDGTHCCPNGYKCDIQASTCLHADGDISPDGDSLGLVVKIPAKTMSDPQQTETLQESAPAAPTAPKDRDVVCPDQQSKCPGGSTCCKLISGQYGCCPIPDAVCCSDKLHCCPSGTTCDVAEGKCNQEGQESIPWMVKFKAEPTMKEKSVICPDQTSECPDGSTCCVMESGDYGCCPIPNAVCCSDKTHCCPSGTTCDVAEGKCNSEEYGSIPWVEKFKAKVPLTEKVVICPDQKSTCPDGNTCCVESSGQYGCCPLPNAVCCSDKTHCCPSGTTCDVAAGKCNSEQYGSIPWVEKFKAEVPLKEKSVICPDQKGTCPDGSTCCLLASGKYGCCPYPNAVCCSDKTHCCPSGTTCDPTSAQCQSEQYGSIPWAEKFKAEVLPKEKTVICPDQKSTCPDGNTCCVMDSGDYGCCPLPNAVCCSDKTHCCPSGTTCDVAEGKCNSEQYGSIPWVEKFKAKVPLKEKGVICPDGQSQCPDGSTCCVMDSGEYGCCPIPNAVCCSDKTHCCPSGTTCDVAEGKCNSEQYGSIPWVEKFKAEVPLKEKGVICPDQKSQCPDGNTCCVESSGEYGCCPLPNAVCCSDKTHCCPSGTTCDVAESKCNSEQYGSIPWVEKFKAEPLPKGGDITCQDQSTCPDGSTCCVMASGSYGCCPIPNAVCCSDKIHCCPSGTTCDVAAGTCNNEEYGSIPWVEKFKAEVPLTEKNVICPDEQSQCPDGSTCCKMSTGEYGCCPIPNAVCCSDKVHCCPSGTTCDVAEGKCNSEGQNPIPWMVKFKAEPTTREKSVICPDQTSECPDGSTCCVMESGDYGCCPIPNAVCCSDKTHCCPSGTTCDVAKGKCNSEGQESIPWMVKFKAEPTMKEKSVICPDQTSECPDGSTCCVMESGDYGCCPIPNAVCCSDKTHCCPSGTTCDVAEGKCNSEEYGSIPWVEKFKAKVPLKEKGVICPDGQSQCPDGSTCCVMDSGEYGCCPIPNAVCCSDKTHCCPSGTTCDVAEGKCNSEEYGSIPWVEKFKAEVPLKEKGVICPDGQSQCPDGSTCCVLDSGEYGCCPIPNAVCCSDKTHCCPSGTTCDVAKGKCNSEQYGSIPWVEKFKAEVPLKEKTVTCPDQQSQCPDGSTCCKQTSGEYGCCPLPNATCCDDGIHCCPGDYKCTSGKCTKENLSVPWSVKQPAKSLGSVECPDKKGTCADGQTCCLLKTGKYGCCPYAKASCCSDKIHCCPSGTTCNPTSQKCDSVTDSFSISYSSIKPAKSSAANSVLDKSKPNIVCPDKKSLCPGGSTCCKLSTGQYGCCPMEKAVCCSDQIHCCPQGTTCDVSGGKCNAGGLEYPASIFTRKLAFPFLSSIEFTNIKDSRRRLTSIMCPDRIHQCPDNTTCCPLGARQWGCCPFPKANCCRDHIHCCPHSMKCDEKAGVCRDHKLNADIPFRDIIPGLTDDKK